MNYVNYLTREDKTKICDLITGREFKKYFCSRPNDFTKIQKGFRAEKLTDEKALRIAKRNVNHALIGSKINSCLREWNDAVDRECKIFSSEMSSIKTLASALSDSKFQDDIDIYLKINRCEFSKEDVEKLESEVHAIKTEREKQENYLRTIRDLENDKQMLTGQLNQDAELIEQLHQQYEVMVQKFDQKMKMLVEQSEKVKAEDEAKIETLKSNAKELNIKLQEVQKGFLAEHEQLLLEKHQLKKKLETALEQIDHLSSPASPLLSNQYRDLVQFDDRDFSTLSRLQQQGKISLCKVTMDDQGKKYLIRCADFDEDGTLVQSVFHDQMEIKFSEREIYPFQGLSSAGSFYGIWTWSDIGFENRIYRPDLCKGLFPIEIVYSAAKDLNELIDQLRRGIAKQVHSRRFLIVCQENEGNLTGVLCRLEDLDNKEGMLRLSEVCAVLPVYVLPAKHMKRTINGICFYPYLFAGIPERICTVKNPAEVVKSIVSSSLNWQALKKRATQKKKYEAFKECVDVLPETDVIFQIRKQLRCSDWTAKSLLDEFILEADNYFSSHTLEDHLLEQAVMTNPALQEKTKDLLRMDWEIEYSVKMNQAMRDLTEIQGEVEKSKAENKQILDCIAQNEQLAQDVEKQVAERIHIAQNSAAEFIAQMAFVNHQPETRVQHQVLTQNSSTIPLSVSAGTERPEAEHSQYQLYPPAEDSEKLMRNENWGEVLETIEDELDQAGVKKEYLRGLADFFGAAYLDKQPIMLVGPNADDIAEASCAALAAQKHGVLYCESNLHHQNLMNIGRAGEKIVVIKNLINSGSMGRLPEILSHKDIFFIVTHPYPEDIQVEPKSLYNYVLPLFTEYLVDKKATGNYIGGYFSDQFKTVDPGPKNNRTFSHRLLSKLDLSPYIRNRAENIVQIIRTLDPDLNEEMQFVLGVLPIAYATQSIKPLVRAMNEQAGGVILSRQIRKDLAYILGEEDE